jgi:hypothetical protein
MENYYIFTEIVNCGKIGRIALDSFHKYHNYKVFIYGTKEDFKLIIPNKNNIFIEVEKEILEGYKNGHLGTALLWEKVIKTCGTKYMIHFDSDVIFRGNTLDEMISKSKDYDIVGPIRNYHHNPHKRTDISFLTDLCQTNCTLFNIDKISSIYTNRNNNTKISLRYKFLSLSVIQVIKTIKNLIRNLIRKNKISIFSQMIRGTYSPFSFGNIDFFDPIMFDMILNGAKIYHLDFNEVGGTDKYGSRNNNFKEINNFPTQYKIDFGSKLVHFSCVGSGMNFYNNKKAAEKVGGHYVKCALDRYALFCKIFYNEIIPEISLKKYKKITEIKNWY